MDKKRKAVIMKKLKENLIAIFLGVLPLVFIMITILILGIFYTHEKSEQAMYNNGIHEEDDGKWELISVYKDENYYYACDKCGKVIHTYNTNN